MCDEPPHLKGLPCLFQFGWFGLVRFGPTDDRVQSLQAMTCSYMLYTQQGQYTQKDNRAMPPQEHHVSVPHALHPQNDSAHCKDVLDLWPEGRPLQCKEGPSP